MSDVQVYRYLFHGRLPDPPTAHHLHTVLKHLVEAARLTVIYGPLVYVQAEGFTAIVVMAESHITINGVGTDCAVDVVSCKRVNLSAIMDVLWDDLRLRDVVIMNTDDAREALRDAGMVCAIPQRGQPTDEELVRARREPEELQDAE